MHVAERGQGEGQERKWWPGKGRGVEGQLGELFPSLSSAALRRSIKVLTG